MGRMEDQARRKERRKAKRLLEKMDFIEEGKRLSGGVVRPSLLKALGTEWRFMGCLASLLT